MNPSFGWKILCLAFSLLLAAGGCKDSDGGDDSEEEDAVPDEEAADETEQDPAADETPAEPDGEDPAEEDAEQEDTVVPPPGAWSVTLGGAEDEEVYALAETPGGGFVALSDTSSFGTAGDCLAVMLDGGGTVLWQASFGGDGLDECRAVLPAAGGGFVVAGRTESFGAGEEGAAWLLGLGAAGEIQWQRVLGGGSAASIAPGHGGGFIVAGVTTAFGAGGADGWVLKLDDGGAVEWQAAYGGGGNETIYAVRQAPDGGYLFSGWTASYGAGGADMWVTKLDGTGAVTWSKTYGGTAGEEGRDIGVAVDGGFVAVGWTASFGEGGADMWILSLDAAGEIEWQRTYGGTGDDRGYAVARTADGGCLAAGRTESFGAGNADMWALRLDAPGIPLWQISLGSSYDEEARAAAATADGSLAVAGKDAFYGSGPPDAWIVLLAGDGTVSTDCPAGMIGDSSAAPVISSVALAEISPTRTETAAAASDTSAVSTPAAGIVRTQCPL